MKLTHSTKQKDIKREWKLFDLKGKILGRIAGEIAQTLLGKRKPYFTYNLDCGDYAVVINASQVEVTGKKEKQKIYTNFSGYPGGLKKKNLEQVRRETPKRIIFEAVSGMLPKNKLRDKMLTRLFVFEGEKHDFLDKFK